MGIIGNNNVEATAWGCPNNALAIKKAALVYTAVAGDVADSVNIYCDSWAVANYYIGIYTVTAGLPDVLVGGEHTVPVPNTGPPKIWRSTAINVPLTAGVGYMIAVRGVGGARGMMDVTELSTGSYDGSSPLPAVWTHASSERGTFSLYANVKNVAPPVINIYYPCCAQLIT